MYTVRVVPIARATAVEELTYFSARKHPRGAVLSVPLRGKEIHGIVIDTEVVAKRRAALRSSDFALRKIRTQEPHGALLPEFIQAAEATARHFATTPGAVIYRYASRRLIASLPQTVRTDTSMRPQLRGFIVPRLYQGLSDHRVEFFRTAVREAFAARGSVIIIAPTVVEAKRLYSTLKIGIESYTYLITSAETVRTQDKRITEALQNPHPVVAIITSGFIGLPRHDLTTIIVEREGSTIHREQHRPFTDVRTLAHHLAAALGGQLFLADLPLRIESMYRRDSGEYEEVVSGNQRITFAAPARILSLKGVPREPKQPFRALGSECLEVVRSTSSEGGRVLLYVARRGLSPLTLCGDCGTNVVCTECSASVVLHKGSSGNYFLCHACGALRSAAERCKHCDSWRLEAFGIGTELVERELSSMLPDARTFVLSSDTAQTPKAAENIAASWYQSRGGILVATELALPYLYDAAPLVGVVSIDALLSLANWNVYEKIAATLTRLRELSREECILQTRHPDTELFHHVLSGNFTSYYRTELKMRKAMGYPPYTTIVKISVTGTEATVQAKMEDVIQHMLPFELIPYPRVLRTPKGVFTQHGFVRLAREKWPDSVLLAKLQSLPPSYTVTVDPDSIL